MVAERALKARFRRFAGLAGLGVVLTGCTTTALPSSPAPSPAAGSGVNPSATSAGSTGAATVRPCQLLSTVDRSEAGLGQPGVDKTIGRDRACDWTQPGVFGVTVTLDETAPLADLKVPKGKGTPLTVGRHRALRVADRAAADGTCAILLAVGENASVQVDVTNSGFSDTTLACGRAATVARLIEPKLP
jgi:hypothetical protein